MKRAFIDTPRGQIHYCFQGTGDSILLLHSTARSVDEYAEMIPILARSVDEYAEMIPILARSRMVIAMDHIGCGDSFKPSVQPTIQDYAASAVQLLDELGIKRIDLVGHLLGAYVGVELAAAHPERIGKLVLSGLGWVDKENGPSMEARFKQWTVKDDGSHYLQIWNFFQSRAPRPIDILARNVLDVLKAGEISEYGHVAVARYTNMADRLRLIRCPTLIIWATKLLEVLGKDHDMSEYKDQFRRLISNCSEEEIFGGSVYLPQHMPDKMAEIVLDFLASKRA